MMEFSITPEEMRAKIAAAEAEAPEIEARLRLAEQAAAEPTFSGWLRKKIHTHGRKSLLSIMSETGISKNELMDFLEGSGELTTGQVSALMSCLQIEFQRDAGAA